MSEDTGLRDRLALERTLLANERTLLAYIRTGLTSAGAGFAVLHLLEGQLAAVTGIVVMLAGASALAIGFWRYRTVRRHLRSGIPPTV